MPGIDLREELRRELRRHPRVVYQKLFDDPESCAKLAAAMPGFVPFRGDTYAAALWVLDWDHRLPSRELVLRLYAFYTNDARGMGCAASRSGTPRSPARICSPSSTCPTSPGCRPTRPTRPS
jgi:hypothetical protein